MTTIKKIKFHWDKGDHDHVVDITNMHRVFEVLYISKNEGLLIDLKRMKYFHWLYGKTEFEQSSPFTTIEYISEREDESDIKKPLIGKIIKKGLPVIAMFDHMDSYAVIYVRSEIEILADDYASEFLEDGDVKSLNDLTVEGLSKVHTYGIREGDDGWDDALSDVKELFG
jgi:hypothetical protein